MSNCLIVAQGKFELCRLPKRRRELLQAWDAADEYMLDVVAEQIANAEKPRILIVNDSFGALAVALSKYQSLTVSDSYLSQQSTRLNLLANNLPLQSVRFQNCLDPLEGVFDWVLIKVPKTLGLLEDQLIRLNPHLTSASQIIVAGMIKHMSPSIWNLLERLVGDTTTSLAKKKARLIFVKFEGGIVVPVSPYPVCYLLENTNYRICNHANVFSRDSLDIGTRFFIQHIPYRENKCDIIDLGCGNGLLGIVAAERCPMATVHFIDESFMAMASAESNFKNAFGQLRNATFRVGDGLMEVGSETADLILCNPPFHQQNSVGDQIAASFFKQSYRVLRKGGEFWVIGNRHLDYQSHLARLFGSCRQIAANSKFVIMKSTKKK